MIKDFDVNRNVSFALPAAAEILAKGFLCKGRGQHCTDPKQFSALDDIPGISFPDCLD
jgi:hypothetical protein